jgi:murein DD-endopeptidase MepM/ murein hydrolase activator NlpD
VQVFCSEECLNAQAVEIVEPPPPAAPHKRYWVLRAGIAVGVAFTLSGGPEPEEPKAPVAASMVPSAPPEPPAFGPAWPPSEEDWQSQIANDAWLHPLDGPSRRMPVRDSRVFGAERPGERPPECVSGHCGVDIGEVWGERVYAVHDGVVERVQRGPNEDHGGVYVRLAHRNGTVFTQYFHLCAVPRWVFPGAQVKAGSLIGLLGDTGVKESGPHLHFTLSVKPSRMVAERFMDPEPLIALWPLRLPIAGTPAVGVDTSAEPGVPLGSQKRKKSKKAPLRASLAGETDAPPPSDAGTIAQKP